MKESKDWSGVIKALLYLLLAGFIAYIGYKAFSGKSVKYDENLIIKINEALKVRDEKLKELDSLRTKQDSLICVLDSFTVEYNSLKNKLEIINRDYEQKLKNIGNISDDDHFRLFSDWLSKKDSL